MIVNQNNMIWKSIKLVKTEDLGDKLAFQFPALQPTRCVILAELLYYFVP